MSREMYCRLTTLSHACSLDVSEGSGGMDLFLLGPASSVLKGANGGVGLMTCTSSIASMAGRSDSDPLLLPSALELSDSSRSRISDRCSCPSALNGLAVADPCELGDDNIASSEKLCTARRSGRRGVDPSAGNTSSRTSILNALGELGSLGGGETA